MAKTAQEMFSIAQEVNTERTRQEIKNSTEALNTTILPNMEAVAQRGRFTYRYRVESDCDSDTIITTLRQLGYEVHVNNRDLTISWNM